MRKQHFSYYPERRRLTNHWTCFPSIFKSLSLPKGFVLLHTKTKMRCTFLISLFFLFLWETQAEVPLSGFFPFGPSNGDATMMRGDDTSSPQIFLSSLYTFFGINQTFLWVNVNGAISFKSMINTYTPTCNAVQSSFSMMGPYWYGCLTQHSNAAQECCVPFGFFSKI